ncbi:IS110 family transposase [Almyronema epifaneia]|uniref:Transposase n=1 Tax=Almyronema epifaneia S1 TaxID=2991925 RepID=A0ABW6I9H2_9CYAN
MPICGLDVGKREVTACVLSSIPENLKRSANRAKVVKIEANQEGIDQLLSMADEFAIEPTGDYGRIFVNCIRNAGKTCLIVPAIRVRYYRKHHDCFNKNDRLDAFFVAAYALAKRSDPYAFYWPHAETLREKFLEHMGLTKMCTAKNNRLWQMLSYRWPEACVSKGGKRPVQTRDFLDPSPPALWRFIAGEPVFNYPSRSASLNSTIGSGLDDLTKAIASQVCDLEREMYAIELVVIDALMKESEFTPYHAVFDEFGFGPLVRAAILTRVYPIQRFLGEDSKPIIEYVYSPNSTRSDKLTKRRVSEAHFKLALGMGTYREDSGQKRKEKKTGCGYARRALFLHVRTRIMLTIGASVNSRKEYLQKHARYYANLDKKIPSTKRVMMACSLISRDLFKALSQL